MLFKILAVASLALLPTESKYLRGPGLNITVPVQNSTALVYLGEKSLVPYVPFDLSNFAKCQVPTYSREFFLPRNEL